MCAETQLIREKIWKKIWHENQRIQGNVGSRTKIGNGTEAEVKNLQEKVEEVIKVQETVKQIESNLSSSQAQIMEEAKKMTDTYTDETLNEMGKR